MSGLHPFVVALLFLATIPLSAQHNAGQRCISCHPQYSIGGTVFNDYEGTAVKEGSSLRLFRNDGSAVSLPASDGDGRVWGRDIPDGLYLPRVGEQRAHTWHVLPGQGDCNECHIPGGNVSSERTTGMQALHTEIPVDNDCAHCHHYPASMSISRLHTPGTLNGDAAPAPVQGSAVIIRGKQYPFDADLHDIRTLRPEIFAEGFFSFFDMLLAVAKQQDMDVQYHWDDSCQTHFIDSFDGTTGDFWYHFSYDAGAGTAAELQNRRQIRWDELLYQPGSSMQLVMGENLAELRSAFKREIERERVNGHMIPEVRITISPSDFRGNPSGSGRISVTKTFSNVQVFSHGIREEGSDSLYRLPFRDNVVTAMDVLYSLQDAGELTLVGRSYFTRLAGKVMESYRIRKLGFPGVGEAHASGRQGFVYTTGNGTFNGLVNNADRKQHVHSDIHVIHAPDFALWRWIELGNPYYEADEPTGVEEMLADYEAVPRGFRLQAPWPQPSSGKVHLSVNVFETDEYDIKAFDLAGRKLATIHSGRLEASGTHEFEWDVSSLPPGSYLLRCSNARSIDVQRVQVVR